MYHLSLNPERVYFLVTCVMYTMHTVANASTGGIYESKRCPTVRMRWVVLSSQKYKYERKIVERVKTM